MSPHGWKHSDSQFRQAVDFVNEEFLHKKVKKRRLYDDYDVLHKIFQKIHVVKAA